MGVRCSVGWPDVLSLSDVSNSGAPRESRARTVNSFPVGSHRDKCTPVIAVSDGEDIAGDVVEGVLTEAQAEVAGFVVGKEGGPAGFAVASGRRVAGDADQK